MHLLDDVHLIGSEIWPHPLLACPRAQAQGQGVVNLQNSSVICVVHGSMIGSHQWQKTGKIAVFFIKTCFKVEVKNLTPSQ